MTINGNRLYQVFKYLVYAFLIVDAFVFFSDEHGAAALQFPHGLALIDIIEAYSATIDTTAWIVLLLMFELETYVLDDEHFTRATTWTLHGLRIGSYFFILYAFYGYIANLAFVSDTVPLAGVSDLCALVPGDWSWGVSLDEFVPITAANCATLSDAGSFLQFRDLPAVVDSAGRADIIGLAWVDVVNAAVWLLIVVVLELDVFLQEHDRFEGLALVLSTASKFVLYSLLVLAAIYWGVKGSFVDFWDAFLWIVAFVFIELNVFEWRQEEHEAAAQSA